MKPKKFTVEFITGVVVPVTAFSSEEAIILAKADQIRAGNSWRSIVAVREVEELPETERPFSY